MHRGEKVPSDLDRPDGNGLEANYELHDSGEAIVAKRLAETEFYLEPWGIDRRGDDGEDGIIYDDKMDFKVRVDNQSKTDGHTVTDSEGDGKDRDDNLVGLIDVKTKSNHKYMGTFNKRHYDHYVEHAEEFDVPTFVVMFQIGSGSSDDELHDEFALDVGSGWVHTSSGDAVNNFPDGNNAVLVPHDQRLTWNSVKNSFKDQRHRQEYR